MFKGISYRVFEKHVIFDHEEANGTSSIDNDRINECRERKGKFPLDLRKFGPFEDEDENMKDS